MKIVAILLALTPSFIHVAFRRMMGASIGKGSRIKFGTILISKKITLGKNVKIGPFAYVSAKELNVDNSTKIKALSAVSARIVDLGKYVHVSPLSIISGDHSEKSIFKVGDHSRFFPFCWIETGEGVEIGSNSGIGGHTLIFTHGVWPDYLDGGPVAFGPVKIGDNVWLPWRVFVMPNVEIGSNAIIGANSTVNKSIPENVVAAGTPARVVRGSASADLSSDEKMERALYVLTEFMNDINFKHESTLQIVDHSLKLAGSCISIDKKETATDGDLVFLVNESATETEMKALNLKGISVINHSTKEAYTIGKDSFHSDFIDFLRKYGVRLSIN